MSGPGEESVKSIFINFPFSRLSGASTCVLPNGTNRKDQRFKDHLYPRPHGPGVPGIQVTLQLTVSQPVRLGVEPLLGPMTRLLTSQASLLRSHGAPHLTRGGSVICLKSVFVIATYVVFHTCITNTYVLLNTVHTNTLSTMLLTVYAWPLSVQAMYSKLRLMLLYSRLQRQLKDLNAFRLDRRQV
jgi:hypothetical protein